MKHKWLTFFVIVGLLMTSSGTVLAQEPLPPGDPATLSKSALAIPKTGSINLADVSSLGASSTIDNGDFEQGSGVGWGESSSNNYTLVIDSINLPITPRGSWAAWLGGADNETSVISQSNISISSPANLHLSYWIGSTDICSFDFGTIKINTTTLQTLDLCSSNNTTDWVDLSIDLSAYNGQTVTLSISATTDVSDVSNFFIDDVYLDGATGNQTLTVSKNGTGSGAVTSNPSGINCGSTCSYGFANNASVTLTASAVSGSTFTGWSGAGCSGTGACIVTMNASQSVTATFTQVSINWGLSATQVDNDVDFITLSIQGGSPPQSHWYNPNGIEVSPTCGFGTISEGIFVQGIYVGRKDYFYINGCNRMPGQYRVQVGTTIDLTFTINAIAAAPGAFNKTGPSNGSAGSTSPTLSWSASSGAASYEYCYDTTNDDACSGWISAGTGTAKIPAGLSPSTTYYWQVRAINADGTTYADGSGTDYWSFVTASGASLCAVGTHPNIVFNDNLESGLANWSFVNGASTRWQYDSPYGLASHSGAHFLYANDSPAAITDATASLVPIAIPANETVEKTNFESKD